MMVHVLSGPIRSGKTSRLRSWAAQHAAVGGVLMPVDAHGQRHFLDLQTGFGWPASARLGDWQAQRIGKFAFAPAAFALAEAVLRGAAAAPAVQCVVIDEVGPLELRGEGLAAAVRAVLAAAPPHVVLVVRQGLVAAVAQLFGLSPREVQLFDEKKVCL